MCLFSYCPKISASYFGLNHAAEFLGFTWIIIKPAPVSWPTHLKAELKWKVDHEESFKEQIRPNWKEAVESIFKASYLLQLHLFQCFPADWTSHPLAVE